MSLDFIWDARSDQWKEGFDCLKAYKDREGHCRVPNEYKERGFPLGSWVQTQRTLIDKMSAARRARLDSLGFEWDILSYQWKRGLEYLEAYKEREGHCRVPSRLRK